MPSVLFYSECGWTPDFNPGKKAAAYALFEEYEDPAARSAACREAAWALARGMIIQF